MDDCASFAGRAKCAAAGVDGEIWVGTREDEGFYQGHLPAVLVQGRVAELGVDDAAGGGDQACLDEDV